YEANNYCYRDQDWRIRRRHAKDDALNHAAARDRESDSNHQPECRHAYRMIQYQPFDRTVLRAKRDPNSDLTRTLRDDKTHQTIQTGSGHERANDAEGADHINHQAACHDT